jgi:hypothetical protein
VAIFDVAIFDVAIFDVAIFDVAIFDEWVRVEQASVKHRFSPITGTNLKGDRLFTGSLPRGRPGSRFGASGDRYPGLEICAVNR